MRNKSQKVEKTLLRSLKFILKAIKASERF